MKILFLTYWGVDEGLSVATVYPNLKILAAQPVVKTIDYVTMERANTTEAKQYTPIEKVQHHPIQAVAFPIHLMAKAFDWFKLVAILQKQVRTSKPDLIICRGAMAGILGYFLGRWFRLPFYVESFEPHAAYMLEGGVWNKAGIKYQFEYFFEEKIKQHAAGLITVSDNYRIQLATQEAIPTERLYTVPCYMQYQNHFAFSAERRTATRIRLAIPPSAKVGIYVGKFGGMYSDTEAFQVLDWTNQFFEKNTFFIILTASDILEVEQKLEAVGINKEQYFVSCVPHIEVPDYLSAADFAYSFHKSSPSKIALSPIKHGEYWTNGLPILIPPGIGDDSTIIEQEGGGAVFIDSSSAAILQALQQIVKIITTPDHRTTIVQLAKKHRSIDLQEAVYIQIVEDWSDKTT